MDLARHVLHECLRGTDKIDFTQGPAATPLNFASGSVSGGSFAQLQARRRR